MTARDDIMKDYVPVNERIGAFLAKHPDGSLQSELVELNDTRVVMRAYAYRTPDDARPGIGYSSLEIPGRTPYTRGSEIENCETSAWGRAIAALGFEVKRGIASAEEVRNKREDGQEAVKVQPGPELTPDGGLIGTAIIQGNQDFNLRETPDGWVIPFRVKNGSRSFIVVAEDALAQAVETFRMKILDQRVTVWGHWTDETIPAKGTKPAINYKILHLSRLQTADFTIPAPGIDEPPADLPLVGETTEAPTAPLFDDVAVA